VLLIRFSYRLYLVAKNTRNGEEVINPVMLIGAGSADNVVFTPVSNAQILALFASPSA
jgi:hypothetical protein